MLEMDDIYMPFPLVVKKEELIFPETDTSREKVIMGYQLMGAVNPDNSIREANEDEVDIARYLEIYT